jgi:hypothetical protein
MLLHCWCCSIADVDCCIIADVAALLMMLIDE